MDRLGPAGEYTTLPVALQPSDVALQVVLDERLCLAATPSVGGRWTCSVFDVVVNVGGFGQTEEQLVLQALVFATVGASIALGLHTTTLVLVESPRRRHYDPLGWH